MPSEIIMFERYEFPNENAFVRIKVWKVQPNVRASKHQYKYSLVYVVDGVCQLRYDNEAGKGDHKHVGDAEYPVTFSTLKDLLTQFRADVTAMRN